MRPKATVHLPPKSYRDAAVHGTQPAVGSSPSPPVASDEFTLSVDHVDLLQQRFTKRVTISSTKFASSTATWSNALIGKCLGREVSSEAMFSGLRPLWSPFGEWELFPLANGFFVFRFPSLEARDEALLGGPWIIDGAVLALSQFDPSFRPSSDHVFRAVIWVRLPELPPGFWSDEIISDILMVVGRVVRLDDHTRLRTRGRFARAAVEVDLSLPLEPGVTVDVETGSVRPFWQQFQYEHIHMFCVRCRRVGHKAPSCEHDPDFPFDGASKAVPTSAPSSSATVRELPSLWASSLMVRRSRRSSSSVDAADRLRSKPSPSSPSKFPQGTDIKASSPHAPTSQLVASHVGLGPTGSAPLPVAPASHVGLGPTGSAPHHATPSSHVRLGPTGSTPQLAAPASHVGLGPTATEPKLSAVSLGGPSASGPASGPSCPPPLTSAFGPKMLEQSSSSPFPLAFGPVSVGDGSGGNAMLEVSDDEARLIQEIMLEDVVDDDGIDFTVAGKKKKKQGQGKMKEICLRLEPRNRGLKKKVRVGGSFGSFSLLHDLAGDATLQQLVDRYDPPPEGVL